MAKTGLLEMKSATITSKGQITIPKELRKEGGFKTGAKVAIMSYDDRIEIRPMEEVSKAARVFRPEYLKKLEKIMKMKGGKTFSSIEELDKELSNA